MIIKKVLQRRDGVKFIVVPKASDIKAGDYVQLLKITGSVQASTRAEPDLALHEDDKTK